MVAAAEARASIPEGPTVTLILEKLDKLILRGQNEDKEISVAASSLSQDGLTTILARLHITLTKISYFPILDVEIQPFSPYSWGKEGETSEKSRKGILGWLRNLVPEGVAVIDVNNSKWLDARWV